MTAVHRCKLWMKRAVVVLLSIIITTLVLGSRQPYLDLVDNNPDYLNAKNKTWITNHPGKSLDTQAQHKSMDYQSSTPEKQASVFGDGKEDGTSLNTPDQQAWFYKPKATKVNRYRYHSIVSNDSVCMLSHPQDVLVIVAVLTAPKHLNSHSIIRKTWGQSRTLEVNGGTVTMRTLFFMGMSSDGDIVDTILLESAANRDLIVDDFIDSYRNLSIKSQMLLHWVHKHCNRPNTYIVKMDDDMLMNPNALLTSIAAQPRTGALFGALIGGNKAARVGRWAIPENQYPFKYLPSYLAGNMYVMTADTASVLFNQSEYFHIISMEDVYVSGVLARLASVKPYGLPGFPIWLTSSPTNICQMLLGKWIAVHKVAPAAISKFWRMLTRGETC